MSACLTIVQKIMWTPNVEYMGNVVRLLESAVRAEVSTEVLNHSREQLEEYAASSPEFKKYLAYVFSAKDYYPSEVRSLSGLVLKNDLAKNFRSINNDTLAYIYDSILPCLNDSNKLVRTTSAQVLSRLVAKTTLLQRGSTIITDLMVCITPEQKDLFLMDGASLALLFMAEDAFQVLDSDECGRPLTRLIPFWIQIFSCTFLPELIRERAMESIQDFFYTLPPALELNMELYVSHLLVLAKDHTCPTLQRKALHAGSLILEALPDILDLPSFSQFAMVAIQFCQQRMDLDMIRDGVEFFECALREHSPFAPVVLGETNFLQMLVPLLCSFLVFTDEDLFELEEELNPMDATIPDTYKDVRHHHKEEDNSEQEDEEVYWTTRRTSGLILDTISKQMDSFLLVELLWNSLAMQFAEEGKPGGGDWRQIEAGILCLGAIGESDSVRTALLAKVPDIVPMLFQHCMHGRHLLIKRISLWTLSRFAPSLLLESQFKTMLEIFILSLNDGNKRVQASALVALRDVFHMEDNLPLQPHFPTLLSALSAYLFRLQLSNYLLLLDCLAVLIQIVTEPERWTSDLLSLFLPHVLQICSNDSFNAVEDPRFVPFMQILEYVYGTVPRILLPPSETLCALCVTFSQRLASEVQKEDDHTPWLHLLPVMQNCLLNIGDGNNAAAKQCLRICFELASKDQLTMDSDCIQVALGMLGHLCLHRPDLVKEGAENLTFMFLRQAELLNALTKTPLLMHNAVWSLFQLCRQYPMDVLGYPDCLLRITRLCSKIMILRESKVLWVSKGMDELSGLFLGFLVLTVPPFAFKQCFDQVGERDRDVTTTLLSWTKIVMRMPETEPLRLNAVEGWARFLGGNVDMISSFVAIVLACLSTFDFRQEQPQLHALLADVVSSIQSYYAQEWNKKIAPLSPEYRQLLAQVYLLR